MKQKLKSGWEWDCVSRWRNNGLLRKKAGRWAYIKNQLNRRARREGREEAKQYGGD